MSNKSRAIEKNTGFRSKKNLNHLEEPKPRNYIRLLFAFLVLFFYTLLLWGNVPLISSLGTHYFSILKNIINLNLPHYQLWVVISGIHFLLVPMIIGRFFLKFSFRKMGLGGISFSQFKVLLLLYLFALPVLIWLSAREDMYQYYLPYIKEGLWTYVLWTNLIMVFEHVSLQGILVVFMEPDFFSGSSEKLSVLEGNEGKSTKRGLKWVRDLQNWFSIDPYYYFVILLDSLLFMLIHVGKPLSEVLTAFPGGVFLALLAFKFKSFLPCYLIHTMTAGTIIFLIMIFN